MSGREQRFAHGARFTHLREVHDDVVWLAIRNARPPVAPARHTVDDSSRVAPSRGGISDDRATERLQIQIHHNSFQRRLSPLPST